MVDAFPQAVFPSIYTIFEKFCRLISKPCFASFVLLKQTPFRCSLRFRNRNRSDGARSGLQGGCGSNFHQNSLHISFVILAECAGALS